MSALSTGITAGVNDWRSGPQPSTWDELKYRYAERNMLARGELFLDIWRTNPYKNDPRVYRNISLLWNHESRVVGFYETVTYQGRLSENSGEGAIPIAPDRLLNDAQTKELMTAIGVLYQKWNWQRQMRFRPKLAAALGDVLTELIDDTERRFVYPRIVWPGYVKEIELDFADNVVAYTLEYQIREEGDNGASTTYTFRKEVDTTSFRYFKDDQPFDYFGDGPVVPNVYGFVPAIWDRHGTDGLNVRGDAATDVSRQQLFNLNSLFSHARDFQHKAFFAPIIVNGRITNETSIDLSAPATEAPSAMAKRLSYLQGGDGVSIEQATFDIGQTLEMLEFMKDGILQLHPEAVFFDRLADAQNVTGPGADRIILPVKGLVDSVRDGLDPNTVHLLQMAISMCGMRVNEGDWDYVPDPARPGTMRNVKVNGELDRRREAFRPFTLESYGNEQMGFEIGERDIVIPSKAERIAMAREIESLQTLAGMRLANVDPDEAQAIVTERNERFAVSLNRGDFGQDFEDQESA